MLIQTIAFFICISAVCSTWHLHPDERKVVKGASDEILMATLNLRRTGSCTQILLTGTRQEEKKEEQLPWKAKETCLPSWRKLIVHRCRGLKMLCNELHPFVLYRAVQVIKAGGRPCMKRNIQTVPFSTYLLFQSKFSRKSKSLKQTLWLICSQGQIWGCYPRSLYMKTPLLEIYFV